MHVTLVEINVHEDKIDEFIEVFRQNHTRSWLCTGRRQFALRCLTGPIVEMKFALLYLRSL